MIGNTIRLITLFVSSGTFTINRRDSHMLYRSLILAVGFALLSTASRAADPAEADFYKITTLPIPSHVYLEVGGIEMMPDGKLAVSSRRGDIYMVTNPLSDDTDKMEFNLFAGGLHEVLGLAAHDGWLYATQRGELSRLKDTNGDARADLIETVCDGWEISGDYHEYAFGSRFDKEGNVWIVLCLTGSFNSNVKYRGWCVRVDSDGKLIPTCSGIRSPGGIGFNAVGDVFYTDNQGPWNGTCSLKHLVPGSFQGHPGGNRWYAEKGVAEVMGPKPNEPKSGSRSMVEKKRVPEYIPPAILFPYQKMGQSASGIAADTTGGKFGPFEDQVFVGDQTHSTVMRCCLEKVKGYYQGACFPFRQGFDSGSLGMRMTNNGSMFVGSTNRGWGSRGGKPYALQRLDWTGKVPFEVLEMKARSDGFLLTFTRPLDPQSAVSTDSYSLSTYTYIFQSSYGSPEVDHTKPRITRVEVAGDGLSARIHVDKLREGHVHELHLDGVRSSAGLPLLHPVGYYTLNFIPDK